MLDIVLRILVVLGVLLLVLAALAVASLLLVLFFPLTYRVFGSRDQEAFGLNVRAVWLFGLVRAVCRYPDPGRLKIKILCFTLCDRALASGGEDGKGTERKKKKTESEKKKAADEKEKAEGEKKNTDDEKEKTESEKKKVEKEAKQADAEKRGADPGGTGEKSCGAAGKDGASEEETGDTGKRQPQGTEGHEGDPCGAAGKDGASGEETEDAGEVSGGEEAEKGFLSGLKAKFQKIKYTFQAIYDKIKKIWKNISHYVNWMQEEETKQLLSESLEALGKMLKSVRPRRIRADIRFGTGAPDTTGYVYGLYCMLSAAWAPGLLLSPDFERRVLEGEFDISGRITVWVLLVNGLKMYKLIRRLKAVGRVSA